MPKSRSSTACHQRSSLIRSELCIVAMCKLPLFMRGIQAPFARGSAPDAVRFAHTARVHFLPSVPAAMRVCLNARRCVRVR